MAEKGEKRNWVRVNRFLVLTLWGAVVPEALGSRMTGRCLWGEAVAGLNDYSERPSLKLLQAILVWSDNF
jgi:hypothetical protein